MKAIELEGKRVTAIQAIWDRDHGARHTGWYLRVRYEEDGDVDDNNCPISDMPHGATDAQIISAVAKWLYDIDGMTTDAAQAMREMIEVKRNA
jgi:hypothetical protein